MNSINQVVIEGNVVRDPTFKETANKRKLCVVPIAVNRYYKNSAGENQNEVGYYDIEAWGDNFSNLLAKYGFKGRGVRVVGRLKQDRWQDDDGKSRSKVFIVAEHIEFRPFTKKDGTESAQSEENSAAEERNIELAAEKVAMEESF